MIHELEELRRQNAELREENARLRGACDAGLTKSGGASSDPAEREDLILESATGFAIFDDRAGFDRTGLTEELL